MSDFCYRWPVLARVEEHAELMDRMMDAVHVRPVAVMRLDRGATWYEARTRCLECSAAAQCKAWLAEAAGTDARVPSFCANEALFSSAPMLDTTPANSRSGDRAIETRPDA